MPHALTNRQREYLEFIRQYIARNESSPRLEEIAKHFGVAAPTAHKMLEALQARGYLYFGRDSISGFFIRLVERAGSAETVVEVVIAGKINQFGEIQEFPSKHGHFATVLQGIKPDAVFVLVAIEAISPANILPQDLIIFDMEKAPQPGDICILPIGERLFLARIGSKTFDKDMHSLEIATQYPIPDSLTDPESEKLLHWYPLAYTEASADYFFQVAEGQNAAIGPLSPELVVATALRLVRQLAF